MSADVTREQQPLTDGSRVDTWSRKTSEKTTRRAPRKKTERHAGVEGGGGRRASLPSEGISMISDSGTRTAGEDGLGGLEQPEERTEALSGRPGGAGTGEPGREGCRENSAGNGKAWGIPGETGEDRCDWSQGSRRLRPEFGNIQKDKLLYQDASSCS